MVALDHALLRLRQDGGSDLLRPDPINQLARQQGHVFRDTALTPGNTLRLFVQQVAHGNIACSAVHHLAGGDFSDSAWCQARARLPVELIRAVHQRLIDHARRELDLIDDVSADTHRPRTHRVFVVDASRSPFTSVSRE